MSVGRFPRAERKQQVGGKLPSSGSPSKDPPRCSWEAVKKTRNGRQINMSGEISVSDKIDRAFVFKLATRVKSRFSATKSLFRARRLISRT